MAGMLKKLPLIFLDIDGVLNAHAYDPIAESCTISPECVKSFNRVLSETDALIVLSSAWRYMIAGGAMTLKGFEYLLRTHGVHCNGRLVGRTCKDEFLEGRGKQICWWLACNSAEFGTNHLVIDDGGTDPVTGEWHDMGIPAAGHPVLWTVGNVGLTWSDAGRAIEMLRGGTSS